MRASASSSATRRCARCVELRVLDRLRDLRRDRDEELDLGVGERARLARADVERALERVAREDRDGEDRLVLVLRAGSGKP